VKRFWRNGEILESIFGAKYFVSHFCFLGTRRSRNLRLEGREMLLVFV